MRSCKRRDLESLVGSLNHACRAVRPGRAFKRRLQDVMTTVKRDGRRVRLNAVARADIEWWYHFGLEWNGTSGGRGGGRAAGGVGLRRLGQLGGMEGKWFQICWCDVAGTSEWGIMPKELLPIVVAAVVWGKLWEGLVIRARCDNMSVVAAVGAGACKEMRSIHLLRCLAWVEAKLSLTIRAEHIKGSENVVADALSRDNVVRSQSIMQAAEEEPVEVPRELLDLLSRTDRSLSEQEWRRLSTLLSTSR